jgi:type I restriction enzyme S subunit
MNKTPSPWPMTRLRDIAEIGTGITLGHEPGAVYSREYPYLRVANVQDGYIDIDDIKTIRIFPSEFTRYQLQKGDILLTEGGDFDKLGRGAVWDGAIPGCLHQNHIFRVRLRHGLSPEFFAAYMASTAGRAYFLSCAKQTTNLASINKSQLSAMPVPVPSSGEQKRITEILDSIDSSIGSGMALVAKLKLQNAGLERDLLNRIDTLARPLASFLSMRPRNGFSPNEVESWTVALGLGCLTPDGFTSNQLKNVPTGDFRYAGARLSDGDLLISRSNTFELVGLVGIYRDVGMPCIYPDLMMRLVPNKLVRAEFLEIVLRNVDAREQIKRMSQGTSGSMVKISASSIVKLAVKVPDLLEQDRLLSICAAEKALHGAEERDIAKLRLLKHGLMDDLLMERVRVPAGIT